MQQLKGGVPSKLLDPFNAFVHRGSLSKQLERRGLLQDWKVAVKDNISVAGWPLTCASKALASLQAASYTATVIDALLEEGVEVVGKTNMDEFGMGYSNNTMHIMQKEKAANCDF
jgi:Asp-tRNA(Asn)/Glu-tRNA(Gln) amidotransferase A subunit family amidase